MLRRSTPSAACDVAHAGQGLPCGTGAGCWRCQWPRPPDHRLVLDGVTAYASALWVARTGVVVAHLRLGPSSSATTSTTKRLVPSSVCQDRCANRPTITTRLPLASDSATWTAWSRQTTTG